MLKKELYEKYLEEVKSGKIRMMVPIYKIKDLIFHSKHFHLKEMKCSWVSIGKYRECLVWNPAGCVFMDDDARRDPKFIKAYIKDYKKN